MTAQQYTLQTIRPTRPPSFHRTRDYSQSPHRTPKSDPTPAHVETHPPVSTKLQSRTAKDVSQSQYTALQNSPPRATPHPGPTNCYTTTPSLATRARRTASPPAQTHTTSPPDADSPHTATSELDTRALQAHPIHHSRDTAESPHHTHSSTETPSAPALSVLFRSPRPRAIPPTLAHSPSDHTPASPVENFSPPRESTPPRRYQYSQSPRPASQLAWQSSPRPDTNSPPPDQSAANPAAPPPRGLPPYRASATRRESPDAMS